MKQIKSAILLIRLTNDMNVIKNNSSDSGQASTFKKLLTNVDKKQVKKRQGNVHYLQEPTITDTFQDLSTSTTWVSARPGPTGAKQTLG